MDGLPVVALQRPPLAFDAVWAGPSTPSFGVADRVFSIACGAISFSFRFVDREAARGPFLSALVPDHPLVEPSDLRDKPEGLFSRQPCMGLPLGIDSGLESDRAWRQPQCHAEVLRNPLPVAVSNVSIGQPREGWKAVALSRRDEARLDPAMTRTIPRLLIFSKQLSRKMIFRKSDARPPGQTRRSIGAPARGVRSSRMGLASGAALHAVGVRLARLRPGFAGEFAEIADILAASSPSE